MIHIGIIDDHPIVVQGLRMVLDKSEWVCVDFVAASRKEAMSLLFGIKPDIIFLDINLPDVNGVEFCRELKTKFPDLKIIALTSYTNKERVAMMLKAGASGYITKNEWRRLVDAFLNLDISRNESVASICRNTFIYDFPRIYNKLSNNACYYERREINSANIAL